MALVGIPLMLASAWLGGWLLTALIATVGVLAVREGWRLLSASPPDLLIVPVFLFALWAPLAAKLEWPVTFQASLALAVLALGVMSLFQAPRSARDKAVWALTLLLYPATLLQSMLWIRLEMGAAELFYLFALVWAGDTAAFEGGKRMGKHKLAPALSPNKTVEGALWALAASLAVAMLAAWLWAGSRSALWYLMAAVVVWFLAVCGDLFESLLKRAAGVKDSGRLLSAHGGVLDRFDSLLWAGAGLYVFSFWRV